MNETTAKLFEKAARTIEIPARTDPLSTERSANLFTLASTFGIPLTPGAEEPFDDSVFFDFKTRYLEWSDARDRALAEYLSATPNLFRAYLPYSHRVLGLAPQVVWYLDELIIQDPVARCLTSGEHRDLEEEKIGTREALQSLSPFRSAIEDGYILLTGPALINPCPSPGKAPLRQRPKIVSSLLDTAEVRTVLGETTGCARWEKMDNDGIWVHHSAQLDSGRICSIRATIRKAGHPIPVWPPGGFSKPEPAGLDEMIAADDPHLADMIDDLFACEIQRTLLSAEQAREFGAAFICDRKLDETILSCANARADDTLQVSTAGVLNLILPYVQGIPPEQLSNLRDQIPEAFRDFRGRVHAIVDDVLVEDAQPEVVRERARREIMRQLRGLDTELKSTMKKAKIDRFGAALVFGTGCLVGMTLGVPDAVLLSLATFGANQERRAWAEKVAAEEKAKGHPFYFLWKARGGHW